MVTAQTFVKTSGRSPDQNNIQSHRGPSTEIKDGSHEAFQIRPLGCLIELSFSHLSMSAPGEGAPVSDRTVAVAFV